MVSRKMFLVLAMTLALALLLPLVALADGGSVDALRPADVDPAKLDATMQTKLSLVPITAEQDARWEAAFEKQMMLLQDRLSPEEMAALDMETLSGKIDMLAIQESAGVKIPQAPVAMKKGAAPDGWFSSGKSNVDLSVARNGDFLLGHKWAPWGYWAHAAMWDGYNGSNKTLHARGYGWGVRHDSSNWFRTQYSRVAVMGVYTNSSIRNSATSYARAQLGEPYTIYTSKTNQSKWYCSKLVWAGYYWRSNKSINLDPNGGYWVTPNNLWYTGWTYVRAIG